MLRIYNTLVKSVEDFKPMRDGHVNMFVCGPTVYDYIHAGNARTFVVFDVIAKYLSYRDYKVHYIQNITDIDDKIIDRANRDGIEPLELAKKFQIEFEKDMHALHVTAPRQYVPATAHIDAIISQVQALIDKGFAYEISDGIYFDLAKFPEYGKLSGRIALSDEDAVSRIDENTEKRNAGDFCLWKYSPSNTSGQGTRGEPSWDSPFGAGRPGWHIEDTAITEAFFGPQYDLHGGGRDLIFPHHEAEITQQESASGLSPFVRYWMHVGFLENKTAKMSKSLGNFKTVHELLEEYSPEVLRLFFLSAHYRAPLDFSDRSLAQAEAGIQRIAEFMDRLKIAEESKPLSSTCDPEIVRPIEDLHKQLVEAMDDDFNTPQALAVLFDLVRLGNHYIDKNLLALPCAGRILDLLDFYHSVFGIIPLKTEKLPKEITELVKERGESRDKKDFTASDSIRDKLSELGWKVDDTPYGPLVKKIL